jgi:hypothetical protein
LEAVIAIVFTVVGSMLVAGVLVGALVKLMTRVLAFLDANYGTPRYIGRRAGSAGPTRRWTGRIADGERDPAWWPRFERQFAEYVEAVERRG